jgi:single-strand selective monofunctional uracil DNA glycosylase
MPASTLPRKKSASTALIDRTREFSTAVGALRFGVTVTKVYNPLDYAGALHEAYLARFGTGTKKVVFLGMNPGPFGMVQTGIPFGEVEAVKNWLKLDGMVKIPTPVYDPRPIEGLACSRSEVSGRRLWGYFAEKYQTPEAFFARNFVANYCPLAFLDQARNVTPDKLPKAEAAPLYQLCDAYLSDMVEILQPEWVIGVGKFARQRAEKVLSGRAIKFGDILHPSPASPAANRGWAEVVERQLQELGLANK